MLTAPGGPSAPWWLPRVSRYRGWRRLSARQRTRDLGPRARPWKESRMTTSSVPTAVLLMVLAAAIFLAMTVGLMLGPLLVALATAFHTSVAVTGQLTAVTALTWG